MEGEREEQGEHAGSGMTSTQAETQPQSCGEENNESPDFQEQEGKEEQGDSGDCDGEVEEDQCVSGAGMSPRGTETATNTQDDADCLPVSPLQTEEEVTPRSVSPHPSNAQNRPSEPCWYCMRSLDSECRPEATKQEDSDPLSPLPSAGQKVSYQTDPRPHFGVAWSSRSTCRPLWGSEGPCWGQRHQEVPDQTDTCPHCHLGLPPDTLRWHEAKCLLFEGLRTSKK